MDSFDKIIKEKVEQINVPYKNTAWKSFCKKAGIKHTISLMQTIGITSIAIFTLGGLGGYYFANHHTNTSQRPETEGKLVTIVEEDEMVVAQDELTISTETITPVVPTITTPNQPQRTPIVHPQDTAPKPLPNQDSIPQNDKWRIIIINPDTIIEN